MIELLLKGADFFEKITLTELCVTSKIFAIPIYSIVIANSLSMKRHIMWAEHKGKKNISVGTITDYKSKIITIL